LKGDIVVFWERPTHDGSPDGLGYVADRPWGWRR
jgi:hypothetical protein